MSGPDACTLSEGKHYISTSNTCVGLHKDPNVLNVVVNGVKTVGPSITFQLTLR